MSHGRIRMTAAALAVGLIVVGCTGGGNSSSSTTGASKSPIVIGISLSLSGDFSDPGNAAKRGYELWAETVNAKGGILGRQVELKIVDDASSPDQVVTNYQNLISKDKVDLVFGPFSTLLSVPAATVANRYHYAFVEPAGGGPAMFEAKLPNVFFVQPAPIVACGQPFVDFIASLPASQRPKTAAYVSLDDPFASPIADAMQQAVRGGRDQDRVQDDLPAGDGRHDSDRREGGSSQPGHVGRWDTVRRRLRAGDGHGPAEGRPRVPLPVERRQLADRVPRQGRSGQHPGDLQLR